MPVPRAIAVILLAGLLLAGNVPGAVAQDETGQGPDRTWLSAAEQAWLEQHPVLRHGVVRGHEPFEFVNDSGFTGLMSDYVTIIAQRLAVDLQIVETDSFGELAQAMREGLVDSASYLPRFPQAASQFGWSEPIISMPIAVFGRPDARLLLDIPAMEQRRVAIERVSRAAEIFSRDWPDLEFVEVESPQEGLLALRNGRVDYFIHNVFSVEYERRKLGIESLKIALQTPYSFEVRISTSREFEPLVPMINKVVANLSDHERSLIFDKWVNSRDMRDADWRRALLTGSIVLAGILSVLGLTILWNRRLTREVEARTADLAESREAMRALAQHLDRVREEEKSRIALEMHDELGHSLTALTMSVRRLGRSLGDKDCSDEHMAAQIAELLQFVKQATATSRRIMSDLRPSVLNDLGLLAAIEWLAHEFEERTGIQCEVDADEEEPELPDGAPIALFRIAQESLTNVAKHAQATAAKVSLHVDAGNLVLAIKDNGVGISADWRDKKGSFGLMGMSERAMAIGGELQVPIEHHGGGLVRVVVPLANSQQPMDSAA